MARFGSYRSAGTPGYQPTKETDILVAVLSSNMSSARGRLKGRNHDGGVVNELAAGVSQGSGGDRIRGIGPLPQGILDGSDDTTASEDRRLIATGWMSVGDPVRDNDQQTVWAQGQDALLQCKDRLLPQHGASRLEVHVTAVPVKEQA